jgi:hypothetical protein
MRLLKAAGAADSHIIQVDGIRQVFLHRDPGSGFVLSCLKSGAVTSLARR